MNVIPTMQKQSECQIKIWSQEGKREVNDVSNKTWTPIIDLLPLEQGGEYLTYQVMLYHSLVLFTHSKLPSHNSKLNSKGKDCREET